MKQNAGFFAVVTSSLAKAAFCLTAAFNLLSPARAGANDHYTAPGRLSALTRWLPAAFILLALALPQTAVAEGGDDGANATAEDEVTAQWWYGARLSAAPGSVSENGGKALVMVTAEVSEWGTSTSDLSYEVTVGKGGDSAVSGTDYKAVSRFNIIIKAGRRSGSNSFHLEPIGDTDWEGDETITIHASGTGGAQSTTLTLTDEGDRPYSGPPVTLSANPSKVSEADGATTVTVTATLPSAAAVDVQATVSVGGGTATSGTDYAAVSDVTITVAKNATSGTGTFTLTPTQDTLAEGDETIIIAGPAGASTPATLTLTDDDVAPAVTLSVSPSSVTENGGAQTVTVTATSASAATKARTLLVAVGNRQDSATPGTDYTVVPAFNITIAANATTATGSFRLTPTNDTSVEDAESISIDGTPESGGVNFTVSGATLTLTDDDAQPAVTLTATPSSVDEAALATSVTVKATAASAVAWARTVTVSVGKTGSAASGTDYAAVSNFDIAIAANGLSGTGTFTLKPIQDTTNEGNETIGVAGTSLNTTVTGTTVTIADDDINPAITLSVSPSSVSESASATSVTVTATAASAMSSARTVSVKVGNTGTATSGTDYAAVSDFTITIAANATSGTGTFTLTPTQDTVIEGGETIGVSGASTGTTVTGTTVALTDDDSLPAVTLSVSSSSVSESASATAVTVTATATGATGAARTVTVSVGQTGSAASGSDYAAVTDFDITIASMATSGTGTFTLTPIQDSLVEHNETIGVDGSSPNTTMTNATITLTDDDKDSVTLSLNRRTLGEEASGTSVTVTATAATAIAVARTVSVSVGDTGTATSGTDYAAVSDFDITIAANATSGTGSFTLTPTQDTTNEGNETIGIAGTNSLSTVTGTTLTLVDDDQDTISLSSKKSAISESWSGSVSLTATRPSATTSAVAVTVVVGAPTDSATEGVDYQEVADFTITIPANQTSATTNFTLTGIRDAVSDNNERLSISGLATGYKVNSVPNGIGIFEWFSTIELKADVSSVSEHDGATTVTVTAHIDPTVYGNVPMTVSVGGGTATSGTDYAAVSNFTINIPNKASSATGTFTLTPTQDSLLESDETININGHGSHFSFYAGRGTSITLTDAQPISLSATPSTVSEGAPATQVAVTATATGTVATPRTLTVSVGDTGTATSGTDYAAVSDFDITIPANKSGATNTFTLTPTKDSAAEGDETIGVAGSSTGAYVYPTTLTLADTDPAVTLSAAPSSISEAAGATSVTVTATAAEAVGSARTVTVSVGDSGTATSGTDYAAVSDFTITIAANETSGTGTFTLTPTDDTALEGDETIHVTGTSAEAATISRTVLTLTDDDLPTIALATVPAYVAVAEGAGLKSVTVRATAAAAMKAETTVTLAIGAGGDSATKTTDYTTSNVQTITIPQGQSTAEASFELTPVQDTLVEGNESVSVSGSSSGGHTVTGTSLTLTDDDKHSISLSASPSSVAESASGTSVTVTATAKSAIASARTVTVKVGGSGTATSGTDYAAVTDFNVTIAANAKTGTGTFTLTPTQDTTVEGSETIGVAGTGTNLTVTGTKVTLTDDDSYPAITLSANPASVSEGASATSVTVTATAASAIASARTVTVSVGGSGTASRGSDYATVADFDITIAANATSGTGTFTLTPKQDTLVEGSETIGVAGASASSTVTATTVTLTDDDTHAITLSASPSSVSESKASETITVTATLNVARTTATDVTVSVGESGDEATSGTDYEAVSDFTVTIAANKTSGTGTFTFKPKTDSAYEGFESVTISGTTAQSGGGSNAANAANTSIPVTNTSLSIHDASNYPAVSLSVSPSSVGEGAGATSVTVTATAASAIASSREVTVSVGGAGTATSGTDYTAVSDFVVKIAANATTGTGTFTLTPTQDTVFEGSETIGFAGTSLSTTVTGTTLTLTDDDSAAVTVNDASASEGDDITFTVTLSEAVQGGLTVTPSFTDGTAVEGTDYDENTTALTFTGTKGETQTFTVDTTEDTTLEANETFTVGLTVSNAPTGVTATDTGTGTINNDDSATVTINDASASEGDDITFTVTLSEAVQGGLTVTPGFTDGTAVEGTDYDENTTALSFTGTANETQTFTVSTTDDDVLEHAETFTVGLSVSGTTLSVTATDTGTGTISDTGDNADNATVTINDASASEGDDITFTVTLDKAVQGGLTVTPSFTDGTAVEGTDYDENTTALTFTGTANETKTFTVSTTEDTVLEDNETFTVGLTVSNAPSGVTSSDTGTGTVNNDDGATVTINDASADEGDSMTFTVTLDKAVQGGLTVTPGFTDGTATEGTDYDENTSALTFTGTANETQTFTVSTTEDTTLEGDETFTVGLSVSNAPGGVTSSDTGTGTINNDDGATVTINDASAGEGDSMTFTVTLGDAVAGGLTVTPSFTDGTAVEGTDYDENTSALSFTGTANETRTFTVSTTEDAVLEGNETFTVGLTVSGTTLSVTATDTGTGTINDDDGSATVTVNDASASEGDDITFTVTLDKAVQGGLKVTPGFTDVTAVEGTDYDENTSALSFTGTANESKTFTVSTTEDAVLEGNETFTVDLTVSGTTLSVTVTDTGTGTVNNDDSATVTIDDASASEGSDMTFTVTLDKAVQGGLTVTPSFTDGTATEGTDYDENTTALSFTGTANETKTFTVSTTGDTSVEGNETFTVGLSVSNAPSGVTATDTGTGTINDNDNATVTVNDASANEGDDITFTVTLDKTVPGGLTVTPSFTDGTATEGTDYDENTSALSFTGTANETKTFTVSTTEDAVLEANETFTVGLSVSNAPSGVTATDTGTGTINNDDSAAVTVNDASADEGDSMTFTVTLDKAVQGGLTVTPGFTDGTATEGTDYDENTTALTFTGTANETKTFTVSTTEDAVLEGNETFTVGLTVSNAPSGVTATDTGTGTVNNDDGATVTINDASASEGDSMTFTVTLGAAVAGGLTVTPSFTDVTAVEGTDYDENTSALSFTGTANETKTFTVSTTEDAVLEGNETFTVGLSVSDTTHSVTATDTGTGTINNDDSAAVTVNDANADEGDDMTFTVTLDKAVQGGLTVTPGFTDVTAVEGTDYDENTSALSFTGTANETKTFTVSTTEDAVLEGNETFTVGLTVSGTTLSVTTTDTGTGTVNNDDGATVTINDASASEGDDITFTVTLGAAVAGGLTVTPSFTDGTAASGDYTANTTALSFTGTANETKTFTVSTTEDAVLEGNETFTVGLSVSDTTHSVTATDTGTGTINNDDSAAVTVNDASASEGDSMTFTVTLDQAVQGGLKVTPGFTDGTATEGTDYDENTSALSFTGTANETKTFTVSTTGDTSVEANETFRVGLTVSGTTLSVTATDTGTGTINDDDGAPAVNLSLNPSSVGEGDSRTKVTVTAAFSNSNTYVEDKTVTVSVGGSGTATPGTDYEAVKDFDITIAQGKTSGTGTFALTPTSDVDVEGNETIGVAGSAKGLTVNSTELTLADDDVDVFLGLDSPSVEEGDSGTTTLTFTAKLTDANGKTLASPNKITASYQALSESGDTATAGEDYTATSGTLTFAPGETSKTIDVRVLGDTVAEGDETLTLKWTGWTDVWLVSYAATGTITDDDSSSLPGITPTPTVELKLDPVSISENGGVSTVTATLSAASTAETTVTVSTTPVDPATTGDYTLHGTTLTIAAGATTSTGTVTVRGLDNEAENEARQVTVSGDAHNTIGVDGPADVVLTLTDDDGTPVTDTPPPPVASAPGKPLYLRAAARGQHQIDLKWWTPNADGHARITGYRIFVSKDAGESWRVLVADTGTDETAYAHTGLRWGTTRHYQVAAINKVALGERSNVAWATTETPTAPWKPNRLTAAAVGQTQIDLDWVVPLDGGSAITGYLIEVSEDAGVNWAVLAADTGNTETSYSHRGLAPDSTRHYRVAAMNEMGAGAWSNVAWATTDPALTPGAVIDLSALAEGQTLINLNWKPPEYDGGSPITGYRIEVSQDAGNRWADLESDTGSTGTTYSHTGLTPDSTRHYRVSAINEVGAGAWSNVARATTGAVLTPGAALDLVALADGQTLINLAWREPEDDGGAAITGYRIEVSLDAGSRWEDLESDTGSTGTTYSHTGLTPDSTRHYRVSAINEVGAGEASNVADATTDPARAPARVIDLAAIADGQTIIHLAWREPEDDGGAAITGYRIEVSLDAGSRWEDLESDTGTTDTGYAHVGLEPATTGHYRVSAINEVGAGEASDVADATTDPARVAARVIDLVALADGQDVINLAWREPEDDGGAAITGYRIEVSWDAGTSWTDLESDTGSTDTTYAHVGLEPATTGYYRVSAMNEAGLSDPSDAAFATTDPARVAARVIDLVAAADGQDVINLHWREPAEDGGAPVTGYRIEVASDAGDAGSRWSDLESDTGSTDTRYAHVGLTPDSTRYYRVSAMNEAGVGESSNEASATTDPARAPARVIDLVAVADGQDVIHLHWREPADDGGAPVTGYRIEVSADASGRWTDLESDTRTTDTNYAHKGLTPDSTRHYRVSAWNEAGLSDPSNEASATTVGKDAYNLAAFGRTVATSAVGVIGGRLHEAERDTPSYLVLGGQTIRLGNGRRDKRKHPPRTEADDEWAPPGRAGTGVEPAPTTGAPTGAVDAGNALTPAAGEPVGPTGAGAAPAPTTGAAAAPAGAGEPLTSMAGAPARGRPLPGALASVTQWAGNADHWQALGSHYRLVPSGLERRPVGAMPSLREFLAASSLELHLGPGGSRAGAGDPVSWTLWYDAELNRFAGQRAGGAQRGEALSAYLGLDYHGFDNVTAGVALTHSTGEMEFDAGGLGYREVDAKVTSLMPYLRWSPGPGWNLWALSGYGSGRLDVQENDEVEHRADLDLYLGAAGVRRELVQFDIGAELAVKADAFGVRVQTEETDYLAGTAGDAGRVRLLLEGSGDWLLDDEQSVRPSLSVGARLDGGDAETGLGAELNAALGYDHLRLGVSLDLRGRLLLAHAEEHYEEWGVGLGLQVDPGQLGIGWSFSVAPTWGNVAGDAAGLWQGGQSLQDYAGVGQPRTGAGWRPDNTELRVQHGALGRRGVVTSFGAMHLAGAGYRDARLGVRFEGRGAAGAQRWSDGLRYELRLAQQARPHEPTDYGLFLDLSGRF